MEIDSKKVVDQRAEFIRKASLCAHNNLWTCTHPDNKGKKCTAICNNYYAYKEV